MSQSDVVSAYRARCQRALNKVRSDCTISVKYACYDSILDSDQYQIVVSDVSGNVIDLWFMAELNMENYPCLKLHP